MPAIPTGEVTFVFTDIEGSTALFHELGEQYLEVLAHHNALLRSVWTTHGGVEVKTEGDAFFVAFASASNALGAAAACQRALAETTWLHGRPVRVRIGLHTGTAVVVDNDYVGLDVHQAARVAGAAHGGQVLLTETTASGLPEELGLHDLGEHRLKDFPTARRLLQLTGPGMDTTFPPPRTTTARSHNLSRPPTRIVGRVKELELTQRTLVGEARLVTLTGAGGLGKTRIALEVGWSVLGWFREGVWFVDLAVLADAARIPEFLARTLGLTERPGATAFDLLVERFGSGLALLVLDNLEQLLEDDGITVLADLLAACPDLSMLATSRERLRLRGEHEVVLDGLPTADAEELFTARALAADVDFCWTQGQIAKICDALDGIPLALELAAARVRTHDPEDLLGGLSQALDLLTEGDRDLPARHRTMRATVAWSWRLCDAEEQAVLRSLAVFTGNAEPAAVGAVHAAPVEDVLQRLVDRSMVVRRGDRLGVLVPIRAFVAEQLGDLRPTLEAGHAAWFAGLAKAAGPHLISAGQAAWLDHLDADAQDLHLAVRRMPAPSAVATVALLVRWWVRRNRWSAGREVLGEVLSRAHQDVDPTALARALAGAAELAVLQGELADAAAYLGRAEDLEADGSASALVMNVRGLWARTSGDLDAAEEAYELAGDLAAAAGDLRLVTIAATNAGEIAHRRAVNRMLPAQTVDDQTRGWLDRARTSWTKGRELAAAMGDEHMVLQLTLNLASIDMALGDLAGAEAVLLEARQLAERLGDSNQRAHANTNLGMIAGQRDDEQAAQYFSDALAAAEDIGDVALQGTVLYSWSLVLDDEKSDGGIGDSLHRIRRSLALAEQVGDVEAITQRTFVLTRLLDLQAQAAGSD